LSAICGVVKGGSDALPAMAQAMWRRGALLYAGRLGACRLGQLGPRGRFWEGDVQTGGGRFALVFDGDILNLAELRQSLERDGHRDQAALDRAVPDEIKPLVRAKFHAVKLALLRRIFIEGGGELPAGSGRAIQDAAGA
jgi:hypothetical protein